MTADTIHHAEKATNRDPFHGQTPAEMVATLGRIDNAIRDGVFHAQSPAAIATYLEIPVAMVLGRIGQLMRRGEDFRWKPEYGPLPENWEMPHDFG